MKKQICSFCKGDHFILNCSQFIKLTVNNRVEKVKQLRLCFNCLRVGHALKDCHGHVYRRCGLKHSTRLHYEKIKIV